MSESAAQDRCACGAVLVSCHGCCEQRCLTCDPYSEHERLNRCCSAEGPPPVEPRHVPSAARNRGKPSEVIGNIGHSGYLTKSDGIAKHGIEVPSDGTTATLFASGEDCIVALCDAADALDAEVTAEYMSDAAWNALEKLRSLVGAARSQPERGGADRLRSVVEAFANPQHWAIRRDGEGHPSAVWIGTYQQSPVEFAREAL
jgi:hypothetical protein